MIEHLSNIQGKEKSSARLTCKLSKVPKEVFWFKGKTVLEDSKKYTMTKGSTEVQLVIHALTADDAGEYRCQAETCESMAILNVEGKTKVTQIFLKHVPIKVRTFHVMQQQQDALKQCAQIEQWFNAPFRYNLSEPREPSTNQRQKGLSRHLHSV